jgi:hypothetical protein
VAKALAERGKAGCKNTPDGLAKAAGIANGEPHADGIGRAVELSIMANALLLRTVRAGVSLVALALARKRQAQPGLKFFFAGL